MRPILAEAVELARRALLELQPTGVGEHLGVTGEDECAATHHFAATLPGYGGWQWAVVVAAPPEADRATVSESALLPGPDALVAPDFVPWDQRVRPGDLSPGDLLATGPDDPRLVPGYLLGGDPVTDEVAEEIGLGRPRVLSLEGREEAAGRWYSEFGPDTDMARSAPSNCGLCGFYVPLAGALRAAFGVCANAMGADGHVVHNEYGCGAHSDIELPTGQGSPLYEAYDDAAVDLIPTAELRPPAEPAVDTPESAAPHGDASGEPARATTSSAASSNGHPARAAAEVDSAAAPTDTDTDPAAEPGAVTIDPESGPGAAGSAPAVGVAAESPDGLFGATPESAVRADATAVPDEPLRPSPENDGLAAPATDAPVPANQGADGDAVAAAAPSSEPVAPSATAAEAVVSVGEVEISHETDSGGRVDGPEEAVTGESPVAAGAADAGVAEPDSAVAEPDSGAADVVEAGADAAAGTESAGAVPGAQGDAGQYDEAWAVSAVRVRPGESGAAGSN